MFKAVLMGNLTADPKVVATQNGNQFVSFTVAHNERVRGENKTTFVNCTAWRSRIGDDGKESGRDLGGIIQKHFHKGDMIYVEGTPTASHYTNSQGNTVNQVGLTVRDFQFCGKSNGGNQAQNHQQESASQMMQVDVQEELPF